jgi:hypothetical protein
VGWFGWVVADDDTTGTVNARIAIFVRMARRPSLVPSAAASKSDTMFLLPIESQHPSGLQRAMSPPSRRAVRPRDGARGARDLARERPRAVVGAAPLAAPRLLDALS